jgi:ankyrin repeat protein
VPAADCECALLLLVTFSVCNNLHVLLHCQTSAPHFQELVSWDAMLLHTMDDVDRTALHLAAQHGHMACVEELLTAGACVDPAGTLRALNEPVLSQTSAVHAAASAGHVDCLTLLLKAGGSESCNWNDSFGRTPLHAAAEAGHLGAIEVRRCCVWH